MKDYYCKCGVVRLKQPSIPVCEDNSCKNYNKPLFELKDYERVPGPAIVGDRPAEVIYKGYDWPTKAIKQRIK